MLNLVSRFWSSLKDDGVFPTCSKSLQILHRQYIRDSLPRKKTRLNGVITRSGKVFDDLVPWQVGHPDVSNYESGIVNSLENHVRERDKLVVVGGGWGVTAATGAKLTGPNGEVMVFEASPQYAAHVRETAELNGCAEQITIENKVVSHSVDTRGSETSDTVVAPEELPDCDVLELDCEGAELEILERMSIRPRVIMIESHGIFDSPTYQVKERLESLSYDIVSMEPAENGVQKDRCLENDIQVITGLHTSGSTDR